MACWTTRSRDRRLASVWWTDRKNRVSFCNRLLFGFLLAGLASCGALEELVRGLQVPLASLGLHHYTSMKWQNYGNI